VFNVLAAALLALLPPRELAGVVLVTGITFAALSTYLYLLYSMSMAPLVHSLDGRTVASLSA
jgi:hypothetical protein